MSYTTSLVLAWFSLVWAAMWPAFALMTLTEAGLAFAIILAIFWVSPIGLATFVWHQPGLAARIGIPVIALAYLGWTMLTALALIGIVYFPAAVLLMIAAVGRTFSPPEEKDRPRGKRSSGEILL